MPAHSSTRARNRAVRTGAAAVASAAMALLGVGVAPTAGAASHPASTSTLRPRPQLQPAGKPKAVKNTQDWSKAHVMYTKKKGAVLPDGPHFDGVTDMTYHGGDVMRDVTNYLIFWDPTTQPAGYSGSMFAAGYRDTIERYFHDISDTPYFNILTQYGDNSGNPVPAVTHYGGTWVDTTTLPHAGTAGDPLNDGDIRNSVDRAIAANPTWQTDSRSTMYFVYTGRGIIECSSAGNCFSATDYAGTTVAAASRKFCAYHWNNGSKVYAYQPNLASLSIGCGSGTTPNGSVDNTVTATSHEQFEAYTDPFGNGWYDDVDGGAGENGDKCNQSFGPTESDGTNIVLHGHRYRVQLEWSNGSPHGCVKRYGPRPATTVTGDLSFGSVPRGTSVTRQIAVQNTGAGDLDILDAFLDGSTNAAFSISPVAPSGATLQSGQTALYNVKVSPSASASSTGPITGNLVLDTDDTVPNDTGAPTNAQLTASTTIPASATVGIPDITLSGSLDFGTVPRGTSATRTLVVQNTGNADLHVSNVTVSGDSAYSISPTSPTSGTLASSDSLVVEVKFAPPANAANGGPLTATVSVQSDDPNEPTVSVGATGIVGLPKAQVTPASLDFGIICPGASTDRELTVTNTGTAPLTINSITIGGGSTPGLAVLSPPVLPLTLPVAAHLAFTVRFTPVGPFGGPVAGTVDVNTDDPTSPTITVPITGTVGQSVLTVSTTALDFGGVATDNRTSPSSKTKTLTLSNTGTCGLSLTSLAIGGAAAADYSIVGGPTLPLTIAAGSSVPITVRFNPTAAGPRPATLTIGTTDPAHPTVDVALTGVGLVPAILTSPASVTYGPTVIQSQAPGYAGVTTPVRITNTGQSELIVDTLGASPTPPFSAPGPATPPSRFATSDGFNEPVTFAPVSVGKFTGNLNVSDNDPEGGAAATVPLCGEGVLRGIRILAVNSAGVPFSSIAKLKLQSHGTATSVNLNLSNLPLVSAPNACVASQMQFDRQGLPTAGTPNQRSSYYTLAITAGGKSTTTTFTLGIDEFKVMTITMK